MSDLLDEAHEFLLCMDKMEYADALFALRAELTEARLVIAGFQSGVTPCDCQPGEFCKPSAPVPQPAVKVGDSFFESWYSLYNPEGKSTKQTMREAYAAGLVDREGRTDWQPAVPEAVAKDALALAYGYLWHVNNMRPGYDAPSGYSRPQLTPEKAAYKARGILRGLLTNEQRGEGINRADAAILSATDSEVKK